MMVNPLKDIRYRTCDEFHDVTRITMDMFPFDYKKYEDSFWHYAFLALLNGIILHLFYKHDKENRPMPSLTDIMSFLSSPGMDTDELFRSMRDYPHIKPEEFLELPILDEAGQEQLDENGILIRYKNPLKEIYGEYIRDFEPFNEALGYMGKPCKSINEIRLKLLRKIKRGKHIDWRSVDSYRLSTFEPYYMLLSHPKAVECANCMLYGQKSTVDAIRYIAFSNLKHYIGGTQ